MKQFGEVPPQERSEYRESDLFRYSNEIPTGIKFGILGVIAGGLLGSLISKQSAVGGAVIVGAIGGWLGHSLDNFRIFPQI